MKDWVKPYLFMKNEKIVRELKCSAEEKKFFDDNFERKMEDKEDIYYSLVGDLNTHFGEGLGGVWEQFLYNFGSVLADLPKDVFLRIKNMKNLFFTYCPASGAEVKRFILEESHDTKNWDEIIIVTFPYEHPWLPHDVARGEIAHELAHVHLEHTLGGNKAEDEADDLAKNWGFEVEIKALREYCKELERQTKIVRK